MLTLIVMHELSVRPSETPSLPGLLLKRLPPLPYRFAQLPRGLSRLPQRVTRHIALRDTQQHSEVDEKALDEAQVGHGHGGKAVDTTNVGSLHRGVGVAVGVAMGTSEAKGKKAAIKSAMKNLFNFTSNTEGLGLGGEEGGGSKWRQAERRQYCSGGVTLLSRRRNK